MLAASMTYLAFTKGFVGITYSAIAIAHLSLLLYHFYNKGTFRKGAFKNEKY